jgi:hypothetical protein
MNPELFCASAIPVDQQMPLMIIAAVGGMIFGLAGYKIGLLWMAHNASQK